MNLKNFVNKDQLQCMRDLCKGEEGEYFKKQVLKLKSHIVCMPKTYETDGQGDNVVVMLHYFKGGSDWYIMERDMVIDDQVQAFGYACLNGDTLNAELGYISITELIKYNVELDLYFEPVTLGEIKKQLTKNAA